jgi:hypothetical protein
LHELLGIAPLGKAVNVEHSPSWKTEWPRGQSDNPSQNAWIVMYPPCSLALAGSATCCGQPRSIIAGDSSPLR